MDYFKIIILGLITFIAAVAASNGYDLAYKLHAVIIMVVAFGMLVWVLRTSDEPQKIAPEGAYFDGVIRAGVIATAFWGIAGFLVGTFIAFQLAFPALNFDWGQPVHKLWPSAPIAHICRNFRLWRQRTDRHVAVCRAADIRHTALGRQHRVVCLLGLSVVHRDGRNRLPFGWYTK